MTRRSGLASGGLARVSGVGDKNISSLVLGTVKDDCPYSLGNPAERVERLRLLHDPLVRPLTEYVNRIRKRQGQAFHIPYFDPLDGGIDARVLFLLEAPGPMAVQSGFISRNNPDQSARNMYLLNQEAGLDRRLTVSWNIVPWYVGDGQQIRPVNASDISNASAYLPELFSLPTKLRTVVLIGRKAQSATPTIRSLTPVPIVDMWHPSPRVLNVWPEKRAEMLAILRRVAAMVR
jgi:uracil-DNA glycosylase